MSGWDESARDATYQDATGYHEPAYQKQEHFWGTAGWQGESAVEDMGSPSNGGRTLARVTLFIGKMIGSPTLDGLAQGRQVLVQVIGPNFQIPPSGTQVLCVFPGGDIGTPGNGAILGWAQSSPTQSFASTTAVWDVGAALKLLIGHAAGNDQILFDGTYVNVGNTPTDFAALASLVNSNFASIVSYLANVFISVNECAALLNAPGPVVGAAGAVALLPTVPNTPTVAAAVTKVL